MIEIKIGTPHDSELLGDWLLEFNVLNVPFTKNPPWEPLCYVINDAEGNLCGGITGQLVLNHVLHIDYLFIKDNYRKLGYGKQLLATIEHAAHERGAYLSYLDTINDDAARFYQQNGYQTIGTLENVPVPGRTTYYMKKEM